MVFRVNGRVGLVDDGSTFLRPATLMMSGACPPPAPSVWKAWMVRPLNAAIVSSTKPELVERVGVDHHLHVVVVGDREAAVDRGRRRAPVLVQLERAGAALDHLLQRAPGSDALPLPAKPRLTGNASAAWIMRPMCQGPGVQVVAMVPCAGPGAAAQHGGDARHQRVLDLLRADEVDVGVEAAGGEDFALAGDDLGAGTDDDGDVGLDVGIAGLADARRCGRP